jgi:ribokinase
LLLRPYIVILAGANASLPSKPYTPLIPQNTTHLLLANEIPLDETLAHLRAAASQQNVTTIYNPSPMPTSSQLAAFPWNCVGWLIVNEGELGDIAKAVFGSSKEVKLDGEVNEAVRYLTNGKDKEDGKKTIEAASIVAKALHTALPRLSSSDNNDSETSTAAVVNIICTLGASGVLYVRRSSSTASQGKHEVNAKCLPAAKLLRPIRDTTGAGDCFMGYLAAGLMRLQRKDGAGGEEGEEEKFEGVLKRCLTVCLSGPLPLLLPNRTQPDIPHPNTGMLHLCRE